MADKRRVARQGQQAAATVATARRQFGREHATQRPAAQPGVLWQAGVKFIKPKLEIARVQLRQRLNVHPQVFVQALQGGG
ncbi:hypothetical protein D9M71_603510 [compost metagenome]